MRNSSKRIGLIDKLKGSLSQLGDVTFRDYSYPSGKGEDVNHACIEIVTDDRRITEFTDYINGALSLENGYSARLVHIGLETLKDKRIKYAVDVIPYGVPPSKRSEEIDKFLRAMPHQVGDFIEKNFGRKKA